jgi:hypothetical protein
MFKKIPLRKKKIIYLPAFFYQAILRNSISFDQLLDYEYIKNKFSKNDLGTVLLLNTNYGDAFNFINDDNLSPLWKGLNLPDFIKINEYTKELYLQKIQEGLLFDGNKKYHINDTHGSYIFVVIYPSIIDNCLLDINTQIVHGLDNSDNFKLIKGILKLLYGYESYESIVNNNLYGTYIKYLL